MHRKALGRMVLTEQEIFIPSPKDIAKESDAFADRDPFKKPWEEIKNYSGLGDPNAKRRITRKADTVSRDYEESSKMQPSGAGAKSKQINPGLEIMNGYGAFDVITPPHDLLQLAHYYDANFANHAAVEAKVLNVVGGGCSFEMSEKAKRKASEAKTEQEEKFIARRMTRVKNDAEAWLDSLNDKESFVGTMSNVITDLCSTGNGYIEIGRTANGKVGYIGHIPAVTMRARRLKDGYVQIIGRRVTYFRNFGAKNSDPIGGDSNPNEVIHIKKYSPLNTYYGIPDIASALPSLIGDQLAEDYNIDYFKNKAVPRYVVTIKGAKLSESSQDRLFNFFRTDLKGSNHRTLYIPLPADSDGNKTEFEMKPVENNIQESSFKGFRIENRNNILIAHQVPITKIGGNDGSTSAIAIAQDRTFRDQVCRPIQRDLEQALVPLILEYSDMIKLVFNEMNIVDETQQASIFQSYVLAGIMTKNEVRERLGLPIIEGLDDTVEADVPDSVVQRETERAAQQSDGPSSAQGRNPKGAGAKEDGNFS